MNTRGSRGSRGSRKAASYNNMKSFLMIVGSIVGGFIVIASVAVYAFTGPGKENGLLASNAVQPYDYTKDAAIVTAKDNSSDTKKSDTGNFLIPPKITTALVLGTDQTDLLTDVVMLAFFNRETGDVDLVSIPRDTYVLLPDDMKEDLKEKGKYTPAAMKLTELHSYAGADYGDAAVKDWLEYEFGVNIDYTVSVSLESFRSIVEIVGPITMEIPAGGLYYSAPDQNLLINIPGGVQELDGRMAEGLVRFRDTYARGDLQRIEVQQKFMKELFKQTLNKETLLNNAGQILSTIIEFVDTDFGVLDAPKYIPYISKLSSEKFNACTVPGAPDYLNGISYFFHDPSLSIDFFQDIMYPPNESEEIKILDVQLYNGGASEEKFEKITQLLESNGYNVFISGDHKGDNKKETRIMVEEGADSAEFDGYFKKVTLIEDGKLPEDYDAVIIVGSGE